MKNLYDVIQRPLISEKSAALTEAMNVYGFEVQKAASKTDVKAAVETLFKVKVLAVRTMIVHGDTRTVGRFTSKRANWKKALVTLEKGQKIELFQGV